MVAQFLFLAIAVSLAYAQDPYTIAKDSNVFVAHILGQSLLTTKSCPSGLRARPTSCRTARS